MQCDQFGFVPYTCDLTGSGIPVGAPLPPPRGRGQGTASLTQPQLAFRPMDVGTEVQLAASRRRVGAGAADDPGGHALEAAGARRATAMRAERARATRRADRELVRSGALVVRPEDLGGERAARAEAERAGRFTVVDGVRVPADTKSYAAVTGLLSDRPGRGKASEVPLRVATQRALRRQER